MRLRLGHNTVDVGGLQTRPVLSPPAPAGARRWARRMGEYMRNGKMVIAIGSGCCRV